MPPLAAGDRILTARAEYASNVIAFLQVAERTGAVVEVIPSDETGQISVEALQEMIDDRVKLIAITHVPTNGGLVNPAAAVGKVARDAGITYLLDAASRSGRCRSTSKRSVVTCSPPPGASICAGHAARDFSMSAASWASGCSRRFSICTRRSGWRRTATRFAAMPGASKTGKPTSPEKSGSPSPSITRARWGSLPSGIACDRSLPGCELELEEIPGVTVRDIGAERCGIVTFTADGIEARQVKQALAERSMNVTTSTVASTRFDMEARGLNEVVRASVHYYNDEAEIERFSRRCVRC